MPIITHDPDRYHKRCLQSHAMPVTTRDAMPIITRRRLPYTIPMTTDDAGNQTRCQQSQVMPITTHDAGNHSTYAMPVTTRCQQPHDPAITRGAINQDSLS